MLPGTICSLKKTLPGNVNITQFHAETGASSGNYNCHWWLSINDSTAVLEKTSVRNNTYEWMKTSIKNTVNQGESVHNRKPYLHKFDIKIAYVRFMERLQIQIKEDLQNSITSTFISDLNSNCSNCMQAVSSYDLATVFIFHKCEACICTWQIATELVESLL